MTLLDHKEKVIYVIALVLMSCDVKPLSIALYFERVLSMSNCVLGM